MSSTRNGRDGTPDGVPNLAEYQDGPDRYIRFAENELDVTLTDQQRRLLRSLAENKRTIIMSGNGPGKSFGVAVAKTAFLWVNYGSVILGTSGSYSQYIDAVWRPLKDLHSTFSSKLPLEVPEPNDSQQPSLELGNRWFAKVVSPRDPGDLEGRHGPDVLVVIEEADKSYITDEHFDSARSSVTSSNDRMLAICNPPRDESNCVYDRLESDGWNTIRFSTLDAHNVRVDAGEIPGPKLPGITDLDTIKEDWSEYNREEWPGIEQAREWSDPDHDDFRTDLDERWYIRRAGTIPPAGTAAHRPIEPSAVEAAWERNHPSSVVAGPEEFGSAVDAARSGNDETILATVIRDALYLPYEQAGDDYTVQRDDILDRLRDDPPHPLAVDAIGEGSGLADMLSEQRENVIRFGAGYEPFDDDEYYTYKDLWAAGLDALGDWLANGGSIDDRKLYEELRIAARVVTFEERHLSSRSTEVLQTTEGKSAIKERIGRSPDRLDAAYMAVWARESGESTGDSFSYVGEMSDLF